VLTELCQSVELYFTKLTAAKHKINKQQKQTRCQYMLE